MSDAVKGAEGKSGVILAGLRPWADIWVRSGWRVRTHAREPIFRLLDPEDHVILTGTREDCLGLGQSLAPYSDARRRAVVLMHGLGPSRRFMRRLERTLAGEGWAVANLDYPSRLLPLDAHAAQARQVAQGLVADGAEEVSFVGHSLGGLIGRKAMAEGWPKGRAVLIGTPNAGARIADRLDRFMLFHRVFGPCAEAVTKDAAASIPVPDREIAIIAGGTGNRGFNPLLRDDNDGIVTIPETRLPPGAEAGFLTFHAIHRTLPFRRSVIAATVSFLETGHLAA
jgi:pimeloyl-ACP methyl ester carboxylesterase